MTVFTRVAGVVIATTHKELQIMRRYPVAIAVLLGWSLLLPAAYVAQAVGFSGSDPAALGAFADRAGTRAVTAYLYLGWAVYLWVSLMLWGPGLSLRDEQLRGSFEALFMTPAPRASLLVGGAPAQLVPAMLIFGVVAAMLRFAFGIPLGWLALIGGLAVIAASIPVLLALGALFAVAVLRFRDAEALVSISRGAVGVLCGVTYPIAVLPGWLRPISNALPPTQIIALLRTAVLHPSSLSGQLGRLWLVLGMAVLCGAVALWLFGRALARSRTTGRLGQF